MILNRIKGIALFFFWLKSWYSFAVQTMLIWGLPASSDKFSDWIERVKQGPRRYEYARIGMLEARCAFLIVEGREPNQEEILDFLLLKAKNGC